MDYPILEGKQEIGTLSVRDEGLYRVFRARCAYREGLWRLWLCGGERTVCLGLLEPKDGALRLQKKLSRAACASLPVPLSFASLGEPKPEAELPAAKAPEPELPAPPKKGPQTVRLFGARFVVFRS